MGLHGKAPHHCSSGWDQAKSIAHLDQRDSGESPGWENVLRDIFAFGGTQPPQQPPPQPPPPLPQQDELTSDEDTQRSFVAFDWSKTKHDYRRVCAMEPAIGDGDGRAQQSDFDDLPDSLRFQQVVRGEMNEEPRPTLDIAFLCIDGPRELENAPTC